MAPLTTGLSIIPALQHAGAKIRAYDPEGMHEAKHMLKDVAFGRAPIDIALAHEMLDRLAGRAVHREQRL